MAHRDSRGRNVAYEHTEFTSGAEIRKAAANAGIGLQYPYESTFFRFADYRTGAENKMSGAAAAKTINIVHSDSYKTTFSYNRWDHLYKMSMYSRAAGAFENTVDELTGKQLGFTNLLVCFAGIADYPGNSGGVQQVDYVSGGEAYFFTRGAVQRGTWQKASRAPAQGLRRRRQRDLLQPGQDLSGHRGRRRVAQLQLSVRGEAHETQMEPAPWCSRAVRGAAGQLWQHCRCTRRKHRPGRPAYRAAAAVPGAAGSCGGH